MNFLADTTIIANPAAQLGAGGAVASQVAEFLLARGVCGSPRVLLTEHPGHAVELAASLAGVGTVIAAGGDGLVNEVMNGLMRIPQETRPRFALVPAGSGNDYARTLGMSAKPAQACEQLLGAHEVAADLGCCNGRYFAETLSFGLDAAIALDTMERRRRCGTTGLRLYAASCVDMLLHQKVERSYTLAVDSAAPVHGKMLLLAVQVGPSYGSGFRIAPHASISDALLDLCIAHPPISTPKAAWMFLRAKGGHHENFKCIEMLRASSVTLSFERELPVQIDGERLAATHYEIGVVPQAVRVLAR